MVGTVLIVNMGHLNQHHDNHNSQDYHDNQHHHHDSQDYDHNSQDYDHDHRLLHQNHHLCDIEINHLLFDLVNKVVAKSGPVIGNTQFWLGTLKYG